MFKIGFLSNILMDLVNCTSVPCTTTVYEIAYQCVWLISGTFA